MNDTPNDAPPAPAEPRQGTEHENAENRPNKKKARAGGGNKPAKRRQQNVYVPAPTVAPATIRRRHWGLIFSFLLFVIAPFVATTYYVWEVAVDQYGSVAGFTVRQEESPGASDLLGGLAQFAGGGGSSDSDVLYEFIQSQALVERINDRIDLVGHYSTRYEDDPVFALKPDASIEDLLRYWMRVVRITYNEGTGLIDLRVLAFDPDFAQRVGQEIVAESQDMINALNDTARNDALGYARTDLDEALGRLKQAREALTQFRLRTQIVDPTADLQGRMGVLNNLQQQLAEAFIEFDLLSLQASSSDPRVLNTGQKIDVIRDRIVQERNSFSNNESGVGADYPTLIAEYESLTVDREFAEETYRAALAAMDVARAEASRQSRYLATYITPTLPQTSEYPQRVVLTGLAALILVLGWSILALIFYSIRDRR